MNRLFLICFFVLAGLNTFSQFSTDTHLISGGISLGSYGRYSHDWNQTLDFDESLTIPVWVQYQTGVPESWNLEEIQSWFSMGAFMGFSGKEFSNKFQGVKLYRDFRYLTFGGLMAFHYVPWLKELDIPLNPEFLDFYVSFKAGLVSERQLNNINEDNPLDYSENKSSRMNLALAPQLGFRYYPKKNLGIMAELGYFNTGTLSVGLSYKIVKGK